MNKDATVGNMEKEEYGKWLVFKVKNQSFAVKCLDVENIFKIDTEPKDLAGYSSYVRGVLDFRGKILPLIEMRKVLEIASFDEDFIEFQYIINNKMQEYNNLIDTLESTIISGNYSDGSFNLSECTLRDWIESYDNNNHGIKSQIKRILEPHDKLCELIKTFERTNFMNSKNEDDVEEQFKNLEENMNNYKNRIIQLLEESISLFKENFKEMCVVLNNGTEKSIGIIVDEVISVTDLTMIDSKKVFDSVMNRGCVTKVASLKDDKKEIFILDIEKLYEKIY